MTVEDATTKQHSLVGVVSWGEGCAKVSPSCFVFFNINCRSAFMCFNVFYKFYIKLEYNPVISILYLAWLLWCLC